jgi:flagellar basal body rod protein FlgC
MELDRALRISAAGMEAQSSRLRVVAENLANRDTSSEVAGGDPYRRKTITFTNRENFKPVSIRGIRLRIARVMLRSRMSIPPLK